MTTGSGSVTLRDATASDVDVLTWVMLAASRSHLQRGIWEYFLDGDEDITLRYLRALATTDAVHLFHQSLFMVAEVDGEPAAAMCAYDADTQGFPVYMTVVFEALQRAGVTTDAAELMRRGAVLQEGMPTVDVTHPWVIENVATRPEFRRRGLTNALLEALLARGRERGFTTAQISVFLGNDPARNAYLKAGFDVAAEQRSDAWATEIGSPGVETLLRGI